MHFQYCGRKYTMHMYRYVIHICVHVCVTGSQGSIQHLPDGSLGKQNQDSGHQPAAVCERSKFGGVYARWQDPRERDLRRVDAVWQGLCTAYVICWGGCLPVYACLACLLACLCLSVSESVSLWDCVDHLGPSAGVSYCSCITNTMPCCKMAYILHGSLSASQ